MATGFGGTHGSTNDDIIVTDLNTNSVLRSYSAWINRDTNGGSSFGRVIDKRTVSGQTEIIQCHGNGDSIQFARGASGSEGNWRLALADGAPAFDEWHHICVTFDSGSASNDAIIYVDGVEETWTQINNYTGSVTNNSDGWCIGNRDTDTSRHFDGSMMEIAIWDRILSAGEAKALAAGFSPDHFPADLVLYAPLLRDGTVNKMAPPSTVSGTAVLPHQRIIYPSAKILPFPPSAATGQDIAVGQVTETDLAQPITFTLGAAPIAAGQVTETDLAQPITITGALSIAIDQVIETDLAQAVVALLLEQTQDQFRFGADDGNEAGHGWIAAQNVNITQSGNTPAILRIQVDNSGDYPAQQMVLQVKKTSDPESAWRDVPVAD